MIENPKVFEPEYKFLQIPIADIEAGAELPLTKDGHIAYDLYRAGLKCAYGRMQYLHPNEDGILKALRDPELRHRVRQYNAAGKPVFLGPSAVEGEDSLTVHSSDGCSISIGIWIPRDGQEVDVDDIPYIRIGEV